MAKLAIVSSDSQVMRYLVSTIDKVIGHEISIEGFSLNEGIGEPRTADLVLTSGIYSAQKAKPYFPDSTIVPSKRVLTGYNLEQLLILPEGKKVLIVNYPNEVSDDIIGNLIDLGVTHLDYIPYRENVDFDLSGIDTAVTTGTPHLIPQNIKNIINLGHRTITIDTFIEVLVRFNLNLKYVDVFEKNYNRLLMDAAKKIRKLLEEAEKFSKYQSIILNEIDEGILSLNSKNQLIISNPAIAELFGKTSNLLDNKTFKEIMKQLDSPMKTEDSAGDTHKSSDVLFTHQNKKIICNINTVKTNEETHKIFTFREVSQIQKLEQKVRRKIFEKGYNAKYTFDDIWGENQLIKAAKDKARVFAKTEETILITGESGTGKELFAQAIHLSSRRYKGPFVAINFAAIPENLVESELFGYEEGAFTGAKKGGKPGIFELAHGGTLFLDEIGDAPLHIQARLLRVLEEKEIISVGGSRVIPIDVRVVAATNKNLVESSKMNKFRLDLFYRLSVLTIETPSLRDFKEEIPNFLQKYIWDKYTMKKEFLPELKYFLMRYKWPGNMRELRNVADYMYYSSLKRKYISIDDTPNYLKNEIDKDLRHGNNESFSRIKAELEALGNLNTIHALMETYHEKKSIGRNRLIHELKNKGHKLTEYQAKKYIKHLSSLNLIEIGRTKQGSSLTELGRDIYKYIST